MSNRLLVTGLSLLLAASCTRSGSKKKDQEAPTKTPETTTTTTATPGAARATKLQLTPLAHRDLTSFAPSRADRVAVLVRFDRLRKTPLGKATERLLSWMPDHARVVGSSGVRVGDVFDMVLITSTSPKTVTATTMAAYTSVATAKLRTMLNNDLSITTWSRAQGGAMGRLSQTPRFDWHDPRVYLTPMPRWIVLVHPERLGNSALPGSGSLDSYPAIKTLAPWVRGLPQLRAVGSSRLISMATLSDLPATMQVPVVGELPAPKKTTIVLQRYERHDVWSGSASFATEKDAAVFASAIEAAKLLIGMGPEGLRLPAGEVSRTLVVRQKDNRLEWSARMSHANSTRLTAFAAAQLKQLSRGWHTTPTPKSAVPTKVTKPKATAKPRRRWQ